MRNRQHTQLGRWWLREASAPPERRRGKCHGASTRATIGVLRGEGCRSRREGSFCFNQRACRKLGARRRDLSLDGISSPSNRQMGPPTTSRQVSNASPARIPDSADADYDIVRRGNGDATVWSRISEMALACAALWTAFSAMAIASRARCRAAAACDSTTRLRSINSATRSAGFNATSMCKTRTTNYTETRGMGGGSRP